MFDFSASFRPLRSGLQSSAANVSISSNGLLLSSELASLLVQLLSDESWSLSVSIQDLQGMVSGLPSRHAAVDFILHALHLLIFDAQERSSNSSGLTP